MADEVVCTTGRVPDWVHASASELGVRFVRLDPLDPDAVSGQLRRHRPLGYLLNWPDLGPFVDADLADAAGGLRIVTYLGQSPEPAFYVDALDLDALRDRSIVVTTAPGAEDAVAESALAFLLAFELRLVPSNLARRNTPTAPVAQPRRHGLTGASLGIVGMGRIGRRVAELAAAFGMELSYFSRTQRPEVEAALGARFVPLTELFAACDHVSLHLPMGTTEGMIDAEVLAHASGVTLINTTSLATLVDPEALLQALERGNVARVGLEGRYREPYDERLRSYGDERVLLMPPYSSYDTPRTERLGWQRYLESLAAVRRREPVPHRIGA